MTQSNETLHVCCYYKEHRPMARKIYGAERVDKQIKENISCCNKCRMFPDLLKYVGVISTDVIVPNEDKFELEGILLKYIPRREGTNRNVNIIYREIHNMSVDEFFKPPKEDKRWIDEI